MAERGACRVLRAPWLCACLSAASVLAVEDRGRAGRVVSVADLHGDYGRTVAILSAARLLDPGTLAWAGGNATLVQTGDIVDRGDHGRQIYELFFRLAREAPLAGGAVVNLLGNHELMNLQGDLRYVSPGDYAAFGGVEARARAWGPGGWLGARVRRFPVATEVGSVLFVHSGLAPEFLEGGRGLAGINEEVAAAIEGGARSSLLQDRGTLWTRSFSQPYDTASMCRTLGRVLELTGTTRMVVGHTIQRSLRASPRCDGQMVLADTAISSAYRGEMSFIEHVADGTAAVVYPGTGQRQALPLPPSPSGKAALWA